MGKTPVIAIFDIGRTNKKILLFDEQYNVVWEKTTQLAETADADGFPSEDLHLLSTFVSDSLKEVSNRKDVVVRAVNFSAYGASLVYLNMQDRVQDQLYNYLKPYPGKLLRRFYDTYGGEEKFSIETASPVLGSLNSGMQLYRLKHEQPQLFEEITEALHLPQYISYIISGHKFSELTSIGCHTNLWDFQQHDYHEWVRKEGLLNKLPPIAASDKMMLVTRDHKEYQVGIGMHDSSATLIPYLVNSSEPFILISSGTWCITLNPFNNMPLTSKELKSDCLCYLQGDGKPVKAARLFLGHQHDKEADRIAHHFHIQPVLFRHMLFNEEMACTLKNHHENISLTESAFARRELAFFSSAEAAYHQLMFDLVAQQYFSVSLVTRENGTKKIFVDGGFSRNDIYMHLLASAFDDMKVYATSMVQGTALGAAIAVHHSWNQKPVASDIVLLKPFSASAASASGIK